MPVSINICHIGSLNASIVSPREVMKSAILSSAAGKLDVRDILLEENGEVNAYYEILEDETMELEEVLESNC